jgi:hypothetical protein
LPLRTMDNSLRQSFEFGPRTRPPREHSAAAALPIRTGHRHAPNVSAITETGYLVGPQDPQ